jgi:hypothetical protein
MAIYIDMKANVMIVRSMGDKDVGGYGAMIKPMGA